MSEIPKEAEDRADEMFATPRGAPVVSSLEARKRVARYIADVSEKAGKAFDLLGGVDDAAEARGLLLPLILPNPEDDLLKEAREIAKVGGYEEDEGVVQIIARGIEHGRQGRK